MNSQTCEMFLDAVILAIDAGSAVSKGLFCGLRELDIAITLYRFLKFWMQIHVEDKAMSHKTPMM
ncbi:uncharacterized protein PHALS_14065 [Plasmopara halstedii]|uniref:Uncharacterized protein n=1 Tax=Plasmopara halstedii TaxID=4781 RepID=A0A0P1AQF8_PLAHL|nr:uncharacterized protein PHALS_14065 [Plasmopara halstedii]CEG43773.1 hypothetical protein PHALS_14065 [Plasmopara halstedii]|eukprot:XP_024580142.1 hypothetical protein PHALS_14065 [Plasmopara halstedii]